MGFILSDITYVKCVVPLSNFNKYLCEFIFSLYHAKHEKYHKRHYMSTVTVLV
jgi:hypothetical protein